MIDLNTATADCMEGFKGCDAGWEVDSSGANTATFWILTGWTSVEAEQRCEKELQTADGLNVHDTFFKKILEKADTGVETHHVAWEMLANFMMDYWYESDNPVWPYNLIEQKEDDVAN